MQKEAILNGVVNIIKTNNIDTLAKDLISCGTAHDGVIECIRYENLPIYGVQWHPDFMLEDIPSSTLINLLNNNG